jgi:hypothetical protein
LIQIPTDGKFVKDNGNCANTLDNTERAIKNRQSRDTGNIGHTRLRKTQHNMCGHHYTQTNTNNVNKTYEPSYK